MKKSDFLQRIQSAPHGQSLVETAIFLPIILLLLAGVLEVSNMLVTQNRVQTGARIGTGFGATNYDETIPITDTFEAMSVVALNNVTETLDLDEERWDIYTVKATVNAAGDGFEEWIWGHPYGTEQVLAESEWTANETQIQNDILDALDASASGLAIVATVSYHHRESFLGLGFFNPGLTRIRGLTVMRISETRGTYGGCDTFPIALSLKNISVFPSDYPVGSLPTGGELYPFVVEDMPYGGNSYWWPNHGHNATDPPPPFYTMTDTHEFPMHTWGVNLADAEYGDLFLVKQADAENSDIAGAFGWLRWDETSNAQSAPTLAESLDWPGNSFTYNHPWWSDDGVINKFDQVLVSTGSIVSSKDEMREHIDEGLRGRELRIIVFTPPDYVEQTGYAPGDANDDGWGTGQNGTPGDLGGGTNFQYEVYAFVRVRIVAWDLSGGNDWLLMEFHAMDEECAVPPATAP